MAFFSFLFAILPSLGKVFLGHPIRQETVVLVGKLSRGKKQKYSRESIRSCFVIYV